MQSFGSNYRNPYFNTNQIYDNTDSLFNYNTKYRTQDSSYNISPGYTAVMNPNVLQNYDKDLLSWLVRMYNALSKDPISLLEVSDIVGTLKNLLQIQTDEYINTILYPEAIKYSKIPSLFPIPTASFQTHFQCSLITNATGQIAFTWNPWYMQDAALSTSFSTFFVNNNNALNGSVSSNYFYSTDIGYTQMPTGIYSQYRIVGASAVVTYTGRMDIVSGVICIGVGMNQIANPQPSGAVGGTSTVDPSSAIFGNFNLIDELPFSKQSQAINGARAIYFPIDNNMQEFAQIPTGSGITTAAQMAANTYYKGGFYIAFYGNGLPISSQCLRVDFFIDFEMTVAPTFNNYIPQAYPSQKYTGNHLETISKSLTRQNVVNDKVAADAILQANAPTISPTGAQDFGSFLKAILGGISQLGPVGDVLASIPGIGSIAKALGMALPGVARGMLNAIDGNDNQRQQHNNQQRQDQSFNQNQQQQYPALSSDGRY
jgi:hypothetical protein